ncbi:MAG: DUF427 domain-containing protein [Candidatus Saccharimonadales bacterium]
MQAISNGKVVANAPKEDLIYIEGNWYFPPNSVDRGYLHSSDTPYTCPWKGACQYFSVGTGDKISKDNAWTYPDLHHSAVTRVKKDFTDYVAFWRDVQVAE